MGVLAMPAVNTGLRLGLVGLRTGALIGPDEIGRAFGLGPVGKDRVLFFSNLFLMQKQFQKI
jgi:hypothetical protein